jgi:hypothetical protein
MNAINGLPLNNVKCDSFKNMDSDLDNKNIDRDLNKIIDKKNRNMNYFEENIHLISLLE